MLDIRKFVSNEFISVSPYGNPVTDLSVDCPFCSSRVGTEDTKGHLHISIIKQVVHCFRCEYSASWIQFIMDYKDWPYHRAFGALYQVPKIRNFAPDMLDDDSSDKILIEQHRVKLPDDFSSLMFTNSPMGLRLIDYLNSRGIETRHIVMYNLGMAPSLPGRVVIPIEGEYWQARTIYGWMHPKYMNPKSEARHYIFNSIALELFDEVVICEGAFSAMAIGENAVAILSKKATEEKIYRFIYSDVEKFIVALDSDATKQSIDLAHLLKRNGKKVDIWEYDEGDPADNNGVIEKSSFNFKKRIAGLLGM